MAYNVGTAFVTIAPSFRGLQTKIGAGISAPLSQAGDKAGQTAGRRFTDRFKSALKIGAVVGGAMAAAAGTKFLKESITEASNLGESINAVNVTFGKSASGIKRLGKDAADSLGLSRSEFNSLSVQFSAFATTIAGKGGDVVGVMDDLTTRGADFASVMNLDVNEAMRLFQSGLAGETEPLRKFGIDLSAAAVEAHAVEKGITASGSAMTEQEKVQARYSLLMEQTAKTQGDFANTSGSLENAQRRLGARWDDIQAQVGAKLIPALERLSGWVLDKGLPALQRFGGWFSDNIIPRLKDFAGFVTGTVVPALQDFGRWVGRNADWLIPLAAGIGTVVAVIKTISAVTKAWAAVQWLLNAALAANPIGIVVVVLAGLVAALVVAYKRSETFRDIVNGAWKAIKNAVSAVWDWMKGMWRGFRDALSAAGDRMSDFLSAVRDAWNRIKDAFSDALAAVRNFLRDAIRGYINLWRGLWDTLKKATKAAWDWIRGAFSWAFDKIQALFDRVIRGWKRIWDGLWDTLKRGTKAAWDAIRGTFSWAFDKIEAAFERVVRGIGRIWNGLKEVARRPVQWVVDVVYNNGIRKVVNAIPGVDDLKPIRMASGGVLPGYTPGRDVHKFYSPTGGELHLSGGEAIMRPEFVRAVGGPAGVDKLNRMVRKFRFGGVAPAPGRWARHSGYANARYAGDINEGSGWDDFGNAVRAWKAGIVAQVKHWTTSYGKHIILNHGKGESSLYAHLSQTGVVPGQNVRQGQTIGAVGNTGNSSHPHLHFEIRGGNADVSPLQDGRSDLLTRLLGRVKGLVGKVGGWVGNLRDMGGWGPMVGKMVRHVVGQFSPWARDQIRANAAPITGIFGRAASTAAGVAGLGPAALRAMQFVREHFNFNGTIGGYANRNIAGTSRLSKHALGKAIDVMTYSNNRLGNQIANYFASPEGRRRFGVDNVIWNRRITNAGRGWNWGAYSGASPHTDHPHIDFYDRGGLLPPGFSLAYNGTGAAEHKAVFTQEQWRTLKGMANRGGSGPGVLKLYDTDGTLMGTMRAVAADEYHEQAAFARRVGR